MFHPCPLITCLHRRPPHTYRGTVYHIRRHRGASFSPLVQICPRWGRGVRPHSGVCGDSTVSSPVTQMELARAARLKWVQALCPMLQPLVLRSTRDPRGWRPVLLVTVPSCLWGRSLTLSRCDEVGKVLMSVSHPVSFRVLPGGSFNVPVFKSPV